MPKDSKNACRRCTDSATVRPAIGMNRTLETRASDVSEENWQDEIPENVYLADLIREKNNE